MGRVLGLMSCASLLFAAAFILFATHLSTRNFLDLRKRDVLLAVHVLVFCFAGSRRGSFDPFLALRSWFGSRQLILRIRALRVLLCEFLYFAPPAGLASPFRV